MGNLWMFGTMTPGYNAVGEPVLGEDIEFLGTLMMAMFGFMLVMFVLSLILYIVYGLAMSTIARNEGYDKPWLAWIPIANYFMIPIMTEQSVHSPLKGRFTKTVLVAYICSFVIGVVVNLAMPSVMESASISIILLILLMVVSLAPTVLLAYGLYFIYDAYSERPGLNLALSILTSGWAAPFQLFRMRNRGLAE